MILSRVEIENYKQFADRHEIEIPTTATIGVIGNNGVGKTTLFEAIEWCLYNPAQIRSAEIRPRGRSGFTKVAVTLDEPDSGRRFIIERELRRSSVTATIYEVEESGNEVVIVQGTKPVTEYVSNRLIGLSHRAFVATFFTRQKELSFFGDMGDSDRRREVSRLLGMETIRLAQQSIADDRKALAADAQSYRRQYDEQSLGRDFDAEITSARTTIASGNAALIEADRKVEAATGEVKQRELELTAIEASRDRDAGFANQLADLGAQRAAARKRITEIAGQIEYLDARAREREHHVAIAARLPELTAELATLETDRERFLRRRELVQASQETGRRRGDLLMSIATTVDGVRHDGRVSGWSWSTDDSDAPAAAIQRLQATIASLDVDAAIAHEQRLVAARESARVLDDASSKLRAFRDRLHQLNEELNVLLVEGEPTVALQELDLRQNAIQRELSDIQASRSHQETQSRQARGLIENLTHAHFGDRCPTCARPFSEYDAGIVVDSLKAQVATFTEAIRTGKSRET
ncbi:MAG TPA: AAA family ATPase, partial [Thermomicrobiales bacterium]|nr:AAA family ATPase [Thermomicrobiales bacterium]